MKKGKACRYCNRVHRSDMQTPFNNLQRISEIDSAINSINRNKSAIIKTFERVPKLNKYILDTWTDNKGRVFYPWMFSKLLNVSDKSGMSTKEDIDKLIAAINNANNVTLNNIPLNSSSSRKLEGIPCSHSYPLVGTQPYLNMDRLPPHAPETVFEMMEVYAMDILRTIPFTAWKKSKAVKGVIDILNCFNKKTAPTINNLITAQTLLRGNSINELAGPYVSQFLLYDYNYGNIPIKQSYIVEKSNPRTALLSEWVNIQHGVETGKIEGKGLSRINSGEVLGSVVHNDPLYQVYYSAAQIALQNGINPEYETYSTSTQWITGGPPDILASIAEVAKLALRVAWASKWRHGMGIRPEVYAQRLNLIHSNPEVYADVPYLKSIYNTEGVQKMIDLIIKQRSSREGEKSILLTLQYPEGSPTHPTWPAGHAVVAGACVTMLKAMFQTHEKTGSRKPLKWVSRAYEVDDRSNLFESKSDSREKMTIEGEFNKLASNISLARDWAGVHFRCDGDCGIALGEQCAIDYLVSKCNEYSEVDQGLFTGYTLSKFSGELIYITRDGVSVL